MVSVRIQDRAKLFASVDGREKKNHAIGAKNNPVYSIYLMGI